MQPARSRVVRTMWSIWSIMRVSSGTARRGRQMREVMREIRELRVAEGRDHVFHALRVGHARAAPVVAQRLEEIVLALVGESRHLLAARIVPVVARRAAV